MRKLVLLLTAVAISAGCADEPKGIGIEAIEEGMSTGEVRQVAGPPTKVLADNNGPEPGGRLLWLYTSGLGWFGVTFNHRGEVISAGHTVHGSIGYASEPPPASLR